MRNIEGKRMEKRASFLDIAKEGHKQQFIERTRRRKEYNKDELYYDVYEFDLEGKKVKVIGVSHAEQLLDYYREALESEISQADTVILEAPIEALNFFGENNMQNAIDLFRDQLHIDFTSPAELEDVLRSDTKFQFFLQVEEMIARLDKTMISVDPLGGTSIEKVSQTEKTDLAIACFKILAMLSSIGIITLSKGSAEISRRNFLKMTGAALVGFIATINGISFSLSELRTYKAGSQKDLTQRNKLWQLLYDSNDYRELCYGEGLAQLATEEEQESFLVICGAQHARNVVHYAETDERKRKARNALYARTYGKIISPLLQRFKFEDGRWNTIEQRELFT